MDCKKIPFSMKPFGWFQVGWSAEIPPGGVKALKYFGNDLVMFRSEEGKLAVLDAHCHHLGAHLGNGGIVHGDKIACPYHGWQWDAQGCNTFIPNQQNTINKKLNTWSVVEKNECIFLWHDQQGNPPKWELPDIFASFPEVPGTEDQFYPAYGQSHLIKPNEAIHPQICFENAVDTAHFQYTHTAPLTPELLEYEFSENFWSSVVGFRSKKDKEFGLHLHAIVSGVGSAFNVFSGRYNYRVIFSATPVDENVSDLFYTVFIPRRPDVDKSKLPIAVRNQLPAELKDMVDNTILATLEEDLLIWRTQNYIDRPVHAQQDVVSYTKLRQWQQRFYNDVDSEPPQPSKIRAV